MQNVKGILFGCCCLVIRCSLAVVIAFYCLDFGGIPVAGEQCCMQDVRFTIYLIGM